MVLRAGLLTYAVSVLLVAWGKSVGNVAMLYVFTLASASLIWSWSFFILCVDFPLDQDAMRVVKSV